jgi:hypothetical protein
MQENESHVRVILFVGFSYTICRIALKSYTLIAASVTNCVYSDA